MTIIAEVLFIAIAVVMVYLVYSMSAPVMSSMQASSSFEQTKSLMLDLDSAIQDTASQGRGSRSTLYLATGAGQLTLDDDHDVIKWTLATDADVISPRSMSKAGNLIVGSNLGAMAYENASAGAYVLENERVLVHIRKIGSPSSPACYNTSDLLMGIYNKDLRMWMNLSRLEISIDNDPLSTNGTGYTKLSETGYALPRGEVSASINTSRTYIQNYTVVFSLEAGADFLTIEAAEEL